MGQGVIDIPFMEGAYLVKDYLADAALELFLSKVSDGYKGLCVTRTNPSVMRKHVSKSVEILWLSSRKVEGVSCCNNLEQLKESILSFVSENESPVILLDRLDYVIQHFGFGDVLDMIYEVNEDISVRKAVMLVNVDPKTLALQELRLLERELKPLPNAQLQLAADLPDDLQEILKFVKITDRTSFKRVGKEFSITKTTTRRRINDLLRRGLVSVHKNGRTKLVRITESGMRFL